MRQRQQVCFREEGILELACEHLFGVLRPRIQTDLTVSIISASGGLENGGELEGGELLIDVSTQRKLD
jgi:hypothetical protein